jgi:hypothetical protein
MDPQSHLSRDKRLRYRLWSILHRLQGFETRFALKVAITTSLLSVPAWLDQSRGWWNFNESWWAVATVWVRNINLCFWHSLTTFPHFAGSGSFTEDRY